MTGDSSLADDESDESNDDEGADDEGSVDTYLDFGAYITCVVGFVSWASPESVRDGEVDAADEDIAARESELQVSLSTYHSQHP